MTLPTFHPYCGLAHRLTETMDNSKGASPHTSHTSRLASMSTPSEAPSIGGDDDEQTKAQRLAELKMQKQKLEKGIGTLNGACKDAQSYLRQALKSGNAAMAYTLIDSAIKALERAEVDHD